MLIKKINNGIISQEFTIKKTLEALQKSTLSKNKICIIKDITGKVVDVLTDGDIRRILLKTNDLNQKILLFLKKKFYYSYKKNSEKYYEKITSKKQIDVLPILNKKKRLIGIYCSSKEKKLDNEIFIFAGGRGKRMFPLTESIPKPMMNIGKLPLIESTINFFKNYGFYNFTISVNYLSKKIENYFSEKDANIKIKFLHEKKKLGTAGPLSIFKNNNKKPIICINGDIYTNLNFRSLLDFHEKSGNDCTICTRNYNFQIPYGVINKLKNKVIDEKPQISKEVIAGIYVFNQKSLNYLKKNKTIDMNDFINFLYKKKKKLGYFHIYELLFDIGDLSTYENVNSYLSNQ